MTDLFAARSQMAMSLGFHIIFASIEVALPLLILIAEALWLKTKDETYQTLAQHWAKDTAIVRSRRCFGHRPIVRVGAAVASLHGFCGSHYWIAVCARRLCFLC